MTTYYLISQEQLTSVITEKDTNKRMALIIEITSQKWTPPKDWKRFIGIMAEGAGKAGAIGIQFLKDLDRGKIIMKAEIKSDLCDDPVCPYSTSGKCAFGIRHISCFMYEGPARVMAKAHGAKEREKKL